MTKRLFALLFLTVGALNAQTPCATPYGYSTPTNVSYGGGAVINYQSVSILSPQIIDGFYYSSGSGGVSVVAGLYSDIAGVPGNLQFSTPVKACLNSPTGNFIALSSPQTVFAGVYWIGVFGPLGVNYGSINGVNWTTQTYASYTLPASASANPFQTNFGPGYYLDVCNYSPSFAPLKSACGSTLGDLGPGTNNYLYDGVILESFFYTSASPVTYGAFDIYNPSSSPTSCIAGVFNDNRNTLLGITNPTLIQPGWNAIPFISSFAPPTSEYVALTVQLQNGECGFNSSASNYDFYYYAQTYNGTLPSNLGANVQICTGCGGETAFLDTCIATPTPTPALNGMGLLTVGAGN